jgi:WbqC-like protein family
MSRRVAIIQSCYIPWRGYFAIIARCDAFIFLDSVQFTRRDWRTRNRIKTPGGPLWLSIPVRQRGQYLAPIDAIEIADPEWSRRHLRSIEAAYRRAPWFASTFPPLRAAYDAVAGEPFLSAINQSLIRAICAMLDIRTPLLRDVDLLPRAALAAMDSTDRLVSLAEAAEADEYLSGPTARAYLDMARFNAANMRLTWVDYDSLPDYPQLWGGFEPAMSVVDGLLNLGPTGARAVLYD